MPRSCRSMGSSWRTMVLAFIISMVITTLWKGYAPPLFVHAEDATQPSGSSYEKTGREKFMNVMLLNSAQTVALPVASMFSSMAVSISIFFSYAYSTIDRSWQYLFPNSTEKAFLPASFYETDRQGAIEVFDKHGMTICRVYKICRLQSGIIQAPEWMENYSSVLKRCGLRKVQYKPTWTLKSCFGIPPYYDWLGPGIPPNSLLTFSKNPLSYFFAHKAAKRSLLDDRSGENKVERSCFAPVSDSDKQKASRICHSKPEGRISNPAFLVNLKKDGVQVDQEFENVLSDEFYRVHGIEADVFDSDSVFLKKQKACFRSVVLAPWLDSSGVSTSGDKEAVISKESLLVMADSLIKAEFTARTEAPTPA